MQATHPLPHPADTGAVQVDADLAEQAQPGYPKTGSYPVADSATGGVGGPMTGAMRSLM